MARTFVQSWDLFLTRSSINAGLTRSAVLLCSRLCQTAGSNQRAPCENVLILRMAHQHEVSGTNFSPMRLLRIPKPFDHSDWIFEPKMDGFRALAHVNGGSGTFLAFDALSIG